MECRPAVRGEARRLDERSTIKQEDIMIAQGNIERGPPAADTVVFEDPFIERQRSGAGFLSFLLFPMISIAAIAFAAVELIR